MKFDFATNGGIFLEAIGTTLYIVAVALGVGGLVGLGLGVLLFITRAGGLRPNAVVFNLLNLLINFFRPIPFIIFIAAMGPLTLAVVGSSIGTNAFIFPAALMVSFASARLVEQSLVSLDPGVVEAAQSMGASTWTIIRTVAIPEVLAPLILAYTFLFVAVVDMSALAGIVAGGGLGAFALSYGYQRFDWAITWITVAVIVLLVQSVQYLGNWLARRALRR
ncbi:methionine ABC transporter permease [Propioniciclava sp.]|uniref:methionine ABC transporter permease n=1 Tax=Propioniciclava sp. TaxID=2038686 RepID=UPI00262A85D0|nr:methionine ABC transporter permease [Propioniciclava sp.]